MLFLLALLAFQDGNIAWQQTETGIFRNLERHHAALTNGGAVFLANPAESQVLLIAEKGMVVRPFGRKGKGPGEMEHITALFYRDGELFVYDNGLNRIAVFDVPGKFLRNIAVPKRRPDLMLTKGGWLIGDWNAVGQGKDEAVLYLADVNMQNLKEVKRFPGPFYHAGMRISRARPGEALCSPLTAKPKLVGTASGQFAYVADALKLQISVIDTQSGKVTQTLNHPHAPIAMDEDWVKAEVKEMASMVPNQNIKPVANVPKNFPAVRDVMLDPIDGGLVIDRWRGRPDQKHHPLRLTLEGKEGAPVENWPQLKKTFGRINKWIYRLEFNQETEEMAVVVRRMGS